ncbi:DUF6234 family protein [Streptomyces sp. NPDC002308]
MPDPPAAAHRPSPAVRGCADAAMAVLVIALELVVCALVALQRALTHRSEDFARQERGDGMSAGPADHPAMDWKFTFAFGVITVVVALVAVSLIRADWPGTGWTQLLVALALVFVTLSVIGGDYGRAHPAETGTGAVGAFPARAAAPPPGDQAYAPPGVRRSRPAGRPRTPSR